MFPRSFSSCRLRRRVASSAILLALVLSTSAGTAAGAPDVAPAVLVKALAVSQTEAGLVGSVAELSIMQREGAGLVFLDTQPFAQVDMQGSARIAVRVATGLSGVASDARDFFFVIRSGSALIGGPSAGAVMTVGALAALNGWPVDPDVYMTGTISPDGSVGPVGGVPEKAAAAAAAGGRLFLYPAGEERAISEGPRGPRVVDMAAHCASIGIECRSVVHVDEALEAFTGMRIQRPPRPSNDSSEVYLETMRPLAEESLSNAWTRVDELARRLGASHTMSDAWRGIVGDALDAASESLTRGQEASDAADYYTAASEAFAAGIALRRGEFALEFAISPTRDTLERLLGDARNASAVAAAESRSAWTNSVSGLQALGAAQVRAREAVERLAVAEQAYRRGDGGTVLREAAFVVERAATVDWWLEISRALGSRGPATDSAAVERAAKGLHAEAMQFLTYAQATLGARSGRVAALGEAQQAMVRADRSLDEGLFMAALLDSVEAQIWASASLSAAAFEDEVPSARLARSALDASRAIEDARARGVEPVLAATTLEHAATLEGLDRLVMIDSARVLAGSVDALLGSAAAPTASPFVASTAITPRADGGLSHGAIAAAGVVAGLILGRFPPRSPAVAARQWHVLDTRNEEDHPTLLPVDAGTGPAKVAQAERVVEQARRVPVSTAAAELDVQRGVGASGEPGGTGGVATYTAGSEGEAERPQGAR